MPWRLEIHHIDVVASGDATLIVAREVFAPGVPGVGRVRSALIDGGRAVHARALHAYIRQQIGLNGRLNVMIVTHYQDDHLTGIIRLLKMVSYLYSNVSIYDQGWPVGTTGQEANYVRYVNAINGLGDGPVLDARYRANRVRVTNCVRADDEAPRVPFSARVGAPAVPALLANINLPANWLLGGAGPAGTAAAPAEILWDGVVGGIPVNAPTMRFIAANRYVRTAAGGISDAIDGGIDPNNEKCLGVEVRFGNFRYYVAGDIETNQETEIQALLNPNDNTAGRVLAMKVSHHGSNTATSRDFVSRLRPEAAFISCGTRNVYKHPATETINVLDGFAANALFHPAVPPAPPNRPIDHYLTGYQLPNPPPPAPPPPPVGRAGDAGLVAGDPQVAPARRGHVVLTVSAAQSNSDVLGGLYLGVRAAANAAATDPGVPNAMAAAAAWTAAGAAAAAAMSSGAALAASAFLIGAFVPPGVQAVAAPAVVNAATAAITAGNDGAQTATAVTAAAMAAGVQAGPAAGAGAAAGVVVGGVEGPSLRNAVTAALTRAGAPGAAGAGDAAAALAAPALGQFDVSYFETNGQVQENITHV